MAKGLQWAGVARGDADAVELTNRLECAIAYQTVLSCGTVLVPIVHVYGPNVVGFILTESGATILVISAQYRSTVYLDRIVEYARIASLHCIIVADVEPGCGYLIWWELAAGPGNDADEAHALPRTSGTTSAPKRARHSCNSLLAEQVTSADVTAAHPSDLLLVVLRPGHIGGTGFMLRPLISDARAVFLHSGKPQKAADLIERSTVTSTGSRTYRADRAPEPGCDPPCQGGFEHLEWMDRQTEYEFEQRLTGHLFGHPNCLEARRSVAQRLAPMYYGLTDWSIACGGNCA